ncbi:MAG: AAA family ATPase [Armatimonadota bacterium]
MKWREYLAICDIFTNYPFTAGYFGEYTNLVRDFIAKPIVRAIMLVEFTVKNYKSFKEETTLSLLATPLKSKRKSLDQEAVFTADNGMRLLCAAAVYGANASGKSNLAAAMDFCSRFMSYSHIMGEDQLIDVHPFLLDPETRNDHSEFEVVQIVDGIQYRYGFAVTRLRVVKEWLYFIPAKRKTEEALFIREGQEIKVESSFKEGLGVEQRTRENVLFLTTVAQWNGEIAKKLTGEFSPFDVISGLQDRLTFTRDFILNEFKDIKSLLLKFVRSFDTGIDDIIIDKESIKQKYPKKLDISNPVENMDMVDLGKSLKTVHRQNDESIIFNLDNDESEGTKKILGLSISILPTLWNGDVLIVDEFDARLHPLLSREIVRLFMNPETNPKHAQLIFMTHDTNLLDRDILRRDQIWFVEKDHRRASHLYSLAEIKVRNDASFEKDYIQGKYGAIPFIGDTRRVFAVSREDVVNA